jgi:Ca2+-binding EF-hand superfamily protein
MMKLGGGRKKNAVFSFRGLFHFSPHRKKLTIAAENMDSLFLWKMPSLYFRAVSIALLLQCFYIAICATQLIPMVTQVNRSAGWIIGLIIPAILNFLVLKMLLNKAVMLRAVFEIDKDVVGKVCEDTLEEIRVVENLRNAVHENLRREEIPPNEWKNYIMGIFNKYDYNQSGNVDEAEFRDFFGDLKIYMSPESFSLVWNVIDFDLSGEVTWDEVFVLLFTHEKEAFKLELEVLQDIREALNDHLTELGVADEEKVNHLKKLFDGYDDNKSGSIARKEFKDIFKLVGLGVSERVFRLVFAAIDTDNSGMISWEEFHLLATGKYLE